jgi:hypothetical protein
MVSGSFAILFLIFCPVLRENIPKVDLAEIDVIKDKNHATSYCTFVRKFLY